MIKKTSLGVFPIALTLAAAASAQTIYIDFDETNMPPPATEIGAAPAPSFSTPFNVSWNVVDALDAPYLLTDVDGESTCASVEIVSGGGEISENGACAGAPELYDGWRVYNTTMVVFDGLVPGSYEVLSYAKTITNLATNVTILGNQKVITNSCNGAHHNPGTYVSHLVTVGAGGALQVVFTYAGGGGGSGWSKMSAMQLIRVNDQTAGTNYCVSVPNSTGMASTISARSPLTAGTADVSVLANSLLLQADNIPAGQSAIFYYGGGQTQIAWGNGFRCVSAGSAVTARLGIILPCANGVIYDVLDFNNPPTAQAQILAGSTWNAQAWYRDPLAGGSAFNLSDAIQLTFGL